MHAYAVWDSACASQASAEVLLPPLARSSLGSCLRQNPASLPVTLSAYAPVPLHSVLCCPLVPCTGAAAAIESAESRPASFPCSDREQVRVWVASGVGSC